MAQQHTLPGCMHKRSVRRTAVPLSTGSICPPVAQGGWLDSEGRIRLSG